MDGAGFHAFGIRLNGLDHLAQFHGTTFASLGEALAADVGGTACRICHRFGVFVIAQWLDAAIAVALAHRL